MKIPYIWVSLVHQNKYIVRSKNILIVMNNNTQFKLYIYVHNKSSMSKKFILYLLTLTSLA